MRVLFKDEMFDAQFLRALNHVYEGGADVGECFATAGRIAEGDTEAWLREWSATGRRLEGIARACLEAGRRESARESFLRASNYFRAAGTFLIGSPDDPRLTELHDRQSSCFQSAGELLPCDFEKVAIPYEGRMLHGYFLRPRGPAVQRRTVIVNGGYDSTAEETYFFSGAAALRRDFNCLLFDGPGQGAALVRDRLVSRPDWEHVITPVVDFLLRRPEVDSTNIALIGISLGGYFAPRAAAHEHRLAACVADPGQFDIGRAALGRLPLPRRLRAGFLESPFLMHLIDRLMRRVARHPTRGWVLRRALHVHGVASPVEYLRVLRDYTLSDCVGGIACPMLVCDAESDPIAGQAKELFEALRCPKQYLRFTASEGAGEHCEDGNRSLLNQRVFDWLEAALAPRSSLVGKVA